ncbi:DUF2202 domain-containing protein [Desulfosarcina sp.]|uniref:DUF2202 domain-containing protein n=1 Tax=Desulfosarcina sp. TaxID=2027861 RepID=UPI0029BF3959|nr:DUF2202 domain-containing protein [Desulfosarcina sp.]MDX2455855.1 DUF2202 domain-containing protein [Desulfosarcina sp.]MDX2493317.1 DUF2202 domain-containing protein [Desulfosarcina sp.]
MRKMFMLLTVFAFVMMFFGTSTVMAGGDQNRGEIGQGSTYENNCEDQPCFEDAPMPGSSDTLIMQSANETSELDDTEIHHLLFIREEEKMARDVYRVLYEKWGNPIFANIVESEQAHMDAMANLIAFYGIVDPVTSDETGEFNDEAIAKLYSDLVERGSQSEIEALLVGAYIEEYDILDIWKAYDETDEERIQTVYQNLYEGSYNHLGAFVYVYELVIGESYVRQILEEEDYEYVMNFDTQANLAQEPKQQKGK